MRFARPCTSSCHESTALCIEILKVVQYQTGVFSSSLDQLNTDLKTRLPRVSFILVAIAFFDRRLLFQLDENFRVRVLFGVSVPHLNRLPIKQVNLVVIVSDFRVENGDSPGRIDRTELLLQWRLWKV